MNATTTHTALISSRYSRKKIRSIGLTHNKSAAAYGRTEAHKQKRILMSRTHLTMRHISVGVHHPKVTLPRQPAMRSDDYDAVNAASCMCVHVQNALGVTARHRR